MKDWNVEFTVSATIEAHDQDEADDRAESLRGVLRRFNESTPDFVTNVSVEFDVEINAVNEDVR